MLVLGSLALPFPVWNSKHGVVLPALRVSQPSSVPPCKGPEMHLLSDSRSGQVDLRIYHPSAVIRGAGSLSASAPLSLPLPSGWEFP